MRRRVFGALLVALVLLALPVQAAETIQRFTAAITIGTDGNVTVREEIRVRAEGAEIRHGLYRDLLTGLPGTYGLVRGRLDVLQVTRDGQTEPWHKTATATGVRLYLGDKDSTVSTGWHTYVLLYRLAGQIRFFGDYDELYWNVTGNAWALPVETASVTLALPGGASLLQRAAYVGRTGGAGREWHGLHPDANAGRTGAGDNAPAAGTGRRADRRGWLAQGRGAATFAKRVDQRGPYQ